MKNSLDPNNLEIESKKEGKSLNSIDQREIVKNLKGRTLMVYFTLLNIKKTGVRDLQRSLELSSPSVARYHLEKLTDLNLLENKNGEYHLIHKANIPALTSWVLLGKQLLPRVIFAATFFTILFLGYLLFIFTFFHKDSVFLVIMACLLLFYLWFDVWWHFRNKPI